MHASHHATSDVVHPPLFLQCCGAQEQQSACSYAGSPAPTSLQPLLARLPAEASGCHVRAAVWLACDRLLLLARTPAGASLGRGSEDMLLELNISWPVHVPEDDALYGGASSSGDVSGVGAGLGAMQATTPGLEVWTLSAVRLGGNTARVARVVPAAGVHVVVCV
jgi:hypothetical protein